MSDTKTYPPKRGSALEAVVERYGGIGKAAKKLGYTYSYVLMVLHGKTPITKNMRKRIAKLKKKKPVYMVVVYMKSEEDKLQAQKLEMKERRRRLLK